MAPWAQPHVGPVNERAEGCFTPQAHCWWLPPAESTDICRVHK